ncbi:serine aminopeptidase domain-containing protein [Urechidicola croceus]|nr:alpha/beta hydrolase [Urechidicola croceus]
MKKCFIIVFVIFSSLYSCNHDKSKSSNMMKELNEKSVNNPNIFVVKTLLFSKDKLPISADLYEVNGLKPTILLCHQAGYSRGEYKDTAIKLNYLGYSCLAIDQRSGNEINDIKNETAIRAKDKGLPTDYLDAKQDIEAAIDYLYSENGNQPIVLVGSSYSASLVLIIGKNNPKVKMVAAFSPGEYLKGVNVTKTIKNYDKPLFVTSSKNEVIKVVDLLKEVNTDNLTHFKPSFKGIHGSRALWESTDGNDQYWKVFQSFLNDYK